MAETNASPTTEASSEHVAAFQTGLSAETRAAAFLTAEGHRILAKRFRTPRCEIDIVAKRRNLLAFVAVKARIIDAARARPAAHPEHVDLELGFDVILIAPPHRPRHSGIQREHTNTLSHPGPSR